MNRSRLAALWYWLTEEQLTYVWALIALFVAAGVFFLVRGVTEPSIRLVGLAFQVLGIATVAWGIRDTRRSFEYPSLTSVAKGWLRRFPLRRRDVVLAAGSAGMSAMTGRLRAHSTFEPTDQTTEARLEALEKNVHRIHARISGTLHEMDEGFDLASKALDREAQKRQAEDATIRAKLEGTATGGLHISVIGAALLLVGVILSTAAPEIAGWFR